MNNSKPLTNLIHEQIYRDVIDGTFSPNDMLTESALIQRYGVSKSPVREALISLCDERVLQSIPRKGYRIVQFTLEEVRQITETRQALELFMFDKAYPSMGERELNLLLECNERIRAEDSPEVPAPRRWEINTGFHLLLASFAENDYMLSLLKSTLRINARAATRYYENIYSPELKEKKRKEEEAILEKECDLYGFLDGKAPMQCGKIQMVLQKKFVYRIHKPDEDTECHDIVQLNYMSRKNFVILQLRNDYLPKCENGKYMLCKMIDKARGYVYHITKTEYNFGMYLLDNGILEKI